MALPQIEAHETQIREDVAQGAGARVRARAKERRPSFPSFPVSRPLFSLSFNVAVKFTKERERKQTMGKRREREGEGRGARVRATRGDKRVERTPAQELAYAYSVNGIVSNRKQRKQSPEGERSRMSWTVACPS
jgi:hypothetical protein